MCRGGYTILLRLPSKVQCASAAAATAATELKFTALKITVYNININDCILTDTHTLTHARLHAQMRE